MTAAAPPPSHLLRTGAFLSRVSTLGGALEIDVVELLEALTQLELDLGAWGRVAVGDGFTRLSVTGRLPHQPEAVERLVDTISGIDRLQGERVAGALDRDGETLVEIAAARRVAGGGAAGSGKHLSATITSLHRRPLTEGVLRCMRAASLADDAAARFTAAARALGHAAAGTPHVSGVSDNFRAPAHHSYGLQLLCDGAQPLAALRETAQLVGVAAPQIKLLEDLHPILARRAPAVAALRVGPGVLFPELSVAFAEVSMESVIRVLHGISRAHRGPTPEETGRNVGALAGALDVDDASALEICFRDTTPVPRIVVDQAPRDADDAHA